MDSERETLAGSMQARDAVDFILKLKEEQRLIMVIGLWFLWSERNAIREEGCRRSAESLARGIHIYAKETADMCVKEKKPKEKRRVRWERPPTGHLKLNCDASFKLEIGEGSWGFLVRDWDGDVVITGRGR